MCLDEPEESITEMKPETAVEIPTSDEKKSSFGQFGIFDKIKSVCKIILIKLHIG